MKIAITGSSGFVGRNFVEKLINKGYEVRLLIREPVADNNKISHMEYVVIDFFEEDSLRNGLIGCTHVFHLAAQVPSVHNDYTVAEELLRSNGIATLNLLNAAIKAKVERFFYISGGNLYRFSSERAACEYDALFPSNFAPYYLTSKLCGEIYTNHMKINGSLDTTIIRVSSPYGRYMLESSVVPIFLNKLLKDEIITIKNGGMYGVDLVFVDSITQGLIDLLTIEDLEFLNLGSGVKTSILELAKTMGNLLNKPSNLLRVEPIETATNSGFGALDISLAKQVINYSPINLEDGLSEYILWKTNLSK
jgi:UDP-glucose 4-epimerase